MLNKTDIDNLLKDNHTVFVLGSPVPSGDSGFDTICCVCDKPVYLGHEYTEEDVMSTSSKHRPKPPIDIKYVCGNCHSKVFLEHYNKIEYHMSPKGDDILKRHGLDRNTAVKIAKTMFKIERDKKKFDSQAG